MAKFTFQVHSFRAATFASAMWAGEGAVSVALFDLFCHPFTEAAHFQAFVTAMDAYIATPALLSAVELAYLLTVGDEGETALTEEHRDRWLAYLVRENLPTATRWPFGVQNPSTFAESDPLGLATSALNGRKVVIIDPLNSAAVNVTRGTNTCTTQAGVPIAPDPNLWDGGGTGNGYLQKLWANLLSLDEQNWVTPSTTIRRFPTDGLPVTIYIRHFAAGQVLDKEIGLAKNTAAWTATSKLIIRGYPGDTAQPLIYAGSSIMALGDPVGSFFSAADYGKYRLLYFFGVFRPSTWEGLKVIGHRGPAGSRIFAHKVFRSGSVVTYRRMTVWDYRGISPTDNADHAAAYPDWVDSQFENRKRMDVDTVIDPGTGAGDDLVTRSAITPATAGSQVLECDIRHADDTSPPWPSTFVGDTIYFNTPNCVIARNKLRGAAPHSQIGGDSGATNATIEDNDVENVDHTCIGVGGNGSIVRRNRLHHYGQRTITAHAAIQVTNASNVTVTENVIWNDGEEYQSTGIRVTTTISGGVIDNTTISYNLLYRAGMYYVFSGLAVAGSITNTDAHHNVLIDVPHYAKTRAAGLNDAPIVLDFGDGVANNATWNNRFHDNLVARLDTSLAMMRSIVGGVGTSYGINGQPIGGGTVYPLWADNTTVDLTAGFPVYETACVLDGTAQSLSIADGSQTGLDPGDTDFTVVAWCKPDIITGTERIVNKSLFTGNQRSWYLERWGEELRFAIDSNGDGVTNFKQVDTSVAADNTFAANQWSMVAGVHSASANTIKAYSNGTLTGPVTHSGGALNSTAAFRIGAEVEAGSSVNFDGSIQHVMFFSAALTEKQLNWLYNVHRGRLYSDLVNSGDTDNPSIANLVSYWELDETGSATRMDSKGTNHLTPTGAPVSGTGGILSPSQPASPLFIDTSSVGNFTPRVGTPVAGWFPATVPLLATPDFNALDILCALSAAYCSQAFIRAQYTAESGVTAQFKATASISPQYIAVSGIMECD